MIELFLLILSFFFDLLVYMDIPGSLFFFALIFFHLAMLLEPVSTSIIIIICILYVCSTITSNICIHYCHS